MKLFEYQDGTPIHIWFRYPEPTDSCKTRRTECVLSVGPKDGAEQYTGAARQNPSDNFSYARGRKIAFRRALSQMGGDPAFNRVYWDAFFAKFPGCKRLP